jgi:hypothetical protein
MSPYSRKGSPPGKEKVSILSDNKQGEVFRYKPSFARTPLFMPRYLELTQTSIQYKMSKLHKKCLFEIPLTEISKVRKLRSLNLEQQVAPTD